MLVTGGAGGVGESTCRLLALSGALVTVADVDAARGASVVERIAADGGTARFELLDVTVEADVEATLARTVAAYGPLGASSTRRP